MSSTRVDLGKSVSSRLGTLNHGEELLTADVEEDEYDALNDETFGGELIGYEEDWEQNHEKLAELDGRERSSHSIGSDYLEDLEDIPKDIVQNLSQVILDDEKEDPAVMTYSKLTHSPRHLEWGRSRSPPPAAFLEPQFCGSPGTKSIWTPDVQTPSDRLSNILKTLQQNSASEVPPLNSASSRLLPNAKTLEELERDMLGDRQEPWSPMVTPVMYPADHRNQHLILRQQRGPKTNWNAPVIRAEQLEQEMLNSSARFPLSSGVRMVSEVEREILLKPCAQTLSEVEREILDLPPPHPSSEHDHRTSVNSAPHYGRRMPPPPPGFSPHLSPGSPAPCFPPMLRPGCTSPVPILPMAGRVSPVVIPGGFGAHRSSMPPLPPHPILNPPRVMTPFPPVMNNHVPLPLQSPPTGFNPNNISSARDLNLRRLLYPRQIFHPLLSKDQLKTNQYRSYQGLDLRYKNHHFDYYAGLMTQREKDWLMRIQLLQLQADNPELDDYYYCMFVKKKAAKEDMTGKENNEHNDMPKLHLPEKVKCDNNKTYTPMQFERSLGKLQAVSVNYPRKILDMGVQRLSEDEDRKVPPNKELLWFKHLLLDIEKLYTILLKAEERTSSEEEQTELVEKLFSGLQTSEDRFVQLISIRKGRVLVLRIIPLLSHEQKLTLLTAVLQNLAPVLKKDRLDNILLYNQKVLSQVIVSCDLSNLVDLTRVLLDNTATTVHSKLGLHILCCLIERGEELYKQGCLDSELESKWCKLVTRVADSLGELNDISDLPDSANTSMILSHLQRFPVDRGVYSSLQMILEQQQNGFSLVTV